MDENDRQKIRGNFRYIIEQLSVEDIRKYLHKKGVFNDDDFQEIEPGRRTERDNVHKLLQILFKKGPRAYPEFILGLKQCGYEHVALRLEDTDPETVHVEFQDKLHTFLEEEGPLVELNRRLWQQAEMLERYKREMDQLRSEYEELRMSKEDLQKRFMKMKDDIEGKGITEKYITDTLDGYMTQAQQVSVDIVSQSPDLPSKPILAHSESESLIGNIAVELIQDIVTFISNPNDNIPPEPNKYATTMRRTVKRLLESDQRHGVFQKVIDKLSWSDASGGFDKLKDVADELFSQGMTWGRIVALYAFGGYVARHAQQNKMTSVSTYIGDYLGKYVSGNLSDWIEQKGGWDDFEERFSEPGASLERKTLTFEGKTLFFTATRLFLPALLIYHKYA